MDSLRHPPTHSEEALGITVRNARDILLEAFGQALLFKGTLPAGSAQSVDAAVASLRNLYDNLPSVNAYGNTDSLLRDIAYIFASIDCGGDSPNIRAFKQRVYARLYSTTIHKDISRLSTDPALLSISSADITALAAVTPDSSAQPADLTDELRQYSVASTCLKEDALAYRAVISQLEGIQAKFGTLIGSEGWPSLRDKGGLNYLGVAFSAGANTSNVVSDASGSTAQPAASIVAGHANVRKVVSDSRYTDIRVSALPTGATSQFTLGLSAKTAIGRTRFGINMNVYSGDVTQFNVTCTAVGMTTVSRAAVDVATTYMTDDNINNVGTAILFHLPAALWNVVIQPSNGTAATEFALRLTSSGVNDNGKSRPISDEGLLEALRDFSYADVMADFVRLRTYLLDVTEDWHLQTYVPLLLGADSTFVKNGTALTAPELTYIQTLLTDPTTWSSAPSVRRLVEKIYSDVAGLITLAAL